MAKYCFESPTGVPNRVVGIHLSLISWWHVYRWGNWLAITPRLILLCTCIKHRSAMVKNFRTNSLSQSPMQNMFDLGLAFWYWLLWLWGGLGWLSNPGQVLWYGTQESDSFGGFYPRLESPKKSWSLEPPKTLSVFILYQFIAYSCGMFGICFGWFQSKMEHVR